MDKKKWLLNDLPVIRKKGLKFTLALMSIFTLAGCSADGDVAVAENESSIALEASIESKEKADAQKKKEEEQQKKAEEESIAVEESIEKAEAESVAKEVEEQRVDIQTVTPSVPSGNAYVEVNGNIPLFTNEDISSTEAWDTYGLLDSLGRVTVANALLGVELMPAEERGSLSDITPTGWNQAEYGVVSGGWLYNRSHLIGHQLTGYDGNDNIMTGTRYFNVEGMLPFENFVANYIEETENHVRYRVTPHFEGNNLLASGVFMEGFSIEDNGEGLAFHIYVPNIQPEVNIDYTNGLSWVDVPEVEVVEEAPVVEEVPVEIVPEVVEVAPVGGDVSSVDANGNGQVTISEAKAAGFSMPIYSDHWLYPYMDDRDGDGMVGE